MAKLETSGEGFMGQCKLRSAVGMNREMWGCGMGKISILRSRSITLSVMILGISTLATPVRAQTIEIVKDFVAYGTRPQTPLN